MTETMTKKRAAAACPICGKPVTAAHKPFCSKRCADVDLHRWLGGAYTVPGTTGPDEGEDFDPDHYG